MGHALDGFEREIGIDDGAAVADEQRKVMHFARFACLKRKAHSHAQAFANQVVMQSADGQECRDRRELPIHATITEDEDVDFLVFDHAARREA